MSDDEIWDALARVVDSELGLDIVELGLVYGIEQRPDRVRITMTLTTPGCPLHDVILEGVERSLARPEGPKVDINLVWDPPWSLEMIGTPGRRALGGPHAGT
jgi:metal-sulfur cluster biosynthetic enzyme